VTWLTTAGSLWRFVVRNAQQHLQAQPIVPPTYALHHASGTHIAMQLATPRKIDVPDYLRRTSVGKNIAGGFVDQLF
jgi:hypothetical protein